MAPLESLLVQIQLAAAYPLGWVLSHLLLALIPFTRTCFRGKPVVGIAVCPTHKAKLMRQQRAHGVVATPQVTTVKPARADG